MVAAIAAASLLGRSRLRGQGYRNGLTKNAFRTEKRGLVFDRGKQQPPLLNLYVGIGARRSLDLAKAILHPLHTATARLVQQTVQIVAPCDRTT